MKVTFRHLTLALTALLLIPLASCGKDNKPIPTPPDPQPAKREDIIGKVHLVTVINFDKEGKIDSRLTLSLDKQLRFSRMLTESFEHEKFTPIFDTEYTYDNSGHLIERESREAGFDWDYKRYKYKDGLLVQFEDLPSAKGATKSITQYTYGPDRKKKSGIYIYAYNQTDGTHYLSYSYEGEVEVETIYADSEKKEPIKRNKRTYDKEGRVIKEVYTEIKLDNGKETITYSRSHEVRFGIFGEEIYTEDVSKYPDGKVTRDWSEVRYTKYNALGLPIAGFLIDEKGVQLPLTLEYTLY
jgi:hypothetical protein